jgi:hypothetical protein
MWAAKHARNTFLRKEKAIINQGADRQIGDFSAAPQHFAASH